MVPRGPARAGATATLPRAKKKKKRIAKTPDDTSPFVASGEGTLPERGSDGEKAVRSRPRHVERLIALLTELKTQP